METLFSLLILLVQLLAVFTVAAFVADHIVTPIMNRRRPK